MNRGAITLIAIGAALLSCRGGEPDRPDSAPAAGRATTPIRDSAGGMAMPGMEGMAHAGMPDAVPHAQRSPTGTPMAGMQHGPMPTGAAPMTGMPHGQMTKGAAPMTGMEHRGMDGMRNRASAAGAPPPKAGMDHGIMPTPADRGEQKLDRLIAALARDSIVRRRIQGDSVLRARWDDAALLAILRAHPPQ